MRKSNDGSIAVPARQRRLQLVYSDHAPEALARGPGMPIRLRSRTAMGGVSLHWNARLEPIIRRVIRAMSEAHPSTLIEELLGPLRHLHFDGLPDNTDDLVGRLVAEINDAMPNIASDRADVKDAALRWLARMEANSREPARRQYRELLSLLE